MRVACAIVLVVGFALPAMAENERGWSFSGSFSGSSNSDGAVLKAAPILGYTFNNHFQTYGGLPFYFVNLSSTAASTTSSTTTTGSGFVNGIGNAFLGGRFDVNNDKLNYTSTVELTAPTGDKSRGFSTGRVTADWTNRFSHRFDSFTPFGSVGIANTISDTTFFVRPFTSLGLVSHFEGGGTYDFSRYVRVSASAYAIQAAGQQTIISKVVKRQATVLTLPKISKAAMPGGSAAAGSSAASGTSAGSLGVGKGSANANANASANRVFETQTETVVPADVADDRGVSAWFGVSPRPELDLYAGYSRSIHYDFNTVFFGVGFRVGK